MRKIVEVVRSRKTIFFIIIGILTILITLYYLRGRKQKLPQPITQPSTTPTPIQKLPKINMGQPSNFDNIPLRLAITERELNLPKEILVYKLIYDEEANKKWVSEVASSFGFNKPTLENNDPVFGQTFIYSSENTYIRSVPSDRIVDYKNNTLADEPIENEIDEEKLLKTAYDFLIKHKFVKDTKDLYLYKKVSLNVDLYGHTDTTKKPNRISLILTKNINGFPLLSSAFDTGVAKIGFNNKGEIVSVYFNDIPSLGESIPYPVKTYAEIQKELNSSAKLASIDDGKIRLLDVPSTYIKNTVITSVEIAYFQETKKPEFLQPIFILKGQSNTSDGKSLPTVYIMPAIKN